MSNGLRRIPIQLGTFKSLPKETTSVTVIPKTRGQVSEQDTGTREASYYEAKYGKVPKGSAYRPGIQYFTDKEWAEIQRKEAGFGAQEAKQQVFTSGSKAGDVYVDSSGNVIQYQGQGEQRRVGLVGKTTSQGQEVRSSGGALLGFIKTEPKTVEVAVGQTLPTGARIDVLGQEVTSGGVRYVATKPREDTTTTPSASERIKNIVWRNVKTGAEKIASIQSKQGEDWVKTTKPLEYGYLTYEQAVANQERKAYERLYQRRLAPASDIDMTTRAPQYFALPDTTKGTESVPSAFAPKEYVPTTIKAVGMTSQEPTDTLTEYWTEAQRRQIYAEEVASKSGLTGKVFAQAGAFSSGLTQLGYGLVGGTAPILVTAGGYGERPDWKLSTASGADFGGLASAVGTVAVTAPALYIGEKVTNLPGSFAYLLQRPGASLGEAGGLLALQYGGSALGRLYRGTPAPKVTTPKPKPRVFDRVFNTLIDTGKRTPKGVTQFDVPRGSGGSVDVGMKTPINVDLATKPKGKGSPRVIRVEDVSPQELAMRKFERATKRVTDLREAFKETTLTTAEDLPGAVVRERVPVNRIYDQPLSLDYFRKKPRVVEVRQPSPQEIAMRKFELARTARTAFENQGLVTYDRAIGEPYRPPRVVRIRDPLASEVAMAKVEKLAKIDAGNLKALETMFKSGEVTFGKAGKRPRFIKVYQQTPQEIAMGKVEKLANIDLQNQKALQDMFSSGEVSFGKPTKQPRFVKVYQQTPQEIAMGRAERFIKLESKNIESLRSMFEAGDVSYLDPSKPKPKTPRVLRIKEPTKTTQLDFPDTTDAIKFEPSKKKFKFFDEPPKDTGGESKTGEGQIQITRTKTKPDAPTKVKPKPRPPDLRIDDSAPVRPRGYDYRLYDKPIASSEIGFVFVPPRRRQDVQPDYSFKAIDESRSRQAFKGDVLALTSERTAQQTIEQQRTDFKPLAILQPATKSQTRTITKQVQEQKQAQRQRQKTRQRTKQVTRLRVPSVVRPKQLEIIVDRTGEIEVPIEVTPPPPAPRLTKPSGGGITRKPDRKKKKEKFKKKRFKDKFLPIADLLSKTVAEARTRRPAIQAKPSVRVSSFKKSLGLRVPVGKTKTRRRLSI